MKNKKIIISIIILIIGLGIIFGTIITFNKKENRKKPIVDNQDKEIVVLKEKNINFEDTKKVKELDVINSRVQKTNISYDIFLTIKNVSGHVLEESDLKVIVKKSNGESVVESVIKNVSQLDINEEKLLQISTTVDIMENDNFVYILERL